MSKTIYIKFLLLLILFSYFTFCSKNNKPIQIEPTKEIIEIAKNRTVTLHYHISDYAKGTGLLLDDKGHVLTSRHVILGWEDRVRISQDSKTFFDAKVIIEEPKLDLVILKTELKRKLPKLEFIDRNDLEINEPVFLFGSAWGLANSFLKGYISNTDRSGFDLNLKLVPLIQTIGTSYPGCSGAGVYLYDGKLIGINRATIGSEPGNSIGLVIPSGYVKTFLNLSKIEI
ncbi:MAG: S1C family serine protease [Leptospira bouyouniensis]